MQPALPRLDAPHQTEPTAPRSYAAGSEVRVFTWKHWSSAFIQFEEDREEPMGWVVDRYADPRNEDEVSREEAFDLAATLVDLPPGAEPAVFSHTEFAPGRKLARVEFHRIHEGLRVDGDFLQVTFHPTTHRRVESRCKWRSLRLRGGRPVMTAPEAVEAAERACRKQKIGEDMILAGTEQAIVEYRSHRDRPGRAEDRVAWIVRLTGPAGGIRVHIDAVRRKVLEVLRSV